MGKWIGVYCEKGKNLKGEAIKSGRLGFKYRKVRIKGEELLEWIT